MLLVSEPNYHTKNSFSENLLAIEMRKIKVKMNKTVYLNMSLLDISKTLIMNFGMIILNQSIRTMQHYFIWIQLALLFILKLRIFIKTLQMVLKKNLTHQIMKFIDHYQKKMNKKVIGLMKSELGGKIITEFVALRPKAYSYLTDHDTVHKKAKGTKKSVIK